MWWWSGWLGSKDFSRYRVDDVIALAAEVVGSEHSNGGRELSSGNVALGMGAMRDYIPHVWKSLKNGVQEVLVGLSIAGTVKSFVKKHIRFKAPYASVAKPIQAPPCV